jgi:hypothetical protein
VGFQNAYSKQKVRGNVLKSFRNIGGSAVRFPNPATTVPTVKTVNKINHDLTDSERHSGESALTDDVVFVDVDVRNVVVGGPVLPDGVRRDDAALVVRQRFGIVSGELQLLRIFFRNERSLVRRELVG